MFFRNPKIEVEIQDSYQDSVFHTFLIFLSDDFLLHNGVTLSKSLGFPIPISIKIRGKRYDAIVVEIVSEKKDFLTIDNTSFGLSQEERNEIIATTYKLLNKTIEKKLMSQLNKLLFEVDSLKFKSQGFQINFVDNDSNYTRLEINQIKM